MPAGMTPIYPRPSYYGPGAVQLVEFFDRCVGLMKPCVVLVKCHIVPFNFFLCCRTIREAERQGVEPAVLTALPFRAYKAPILPGMYLSGVRLQITTKPDSCPAKD